MQNRLKNKEARELYFGNLNTFHANAAVMSDLLTPACEQLAEYNRELGPAITSIKMATNNVYH